jgi:hypothetical protein
MLKSEAIKHFGSRGKLARALGITRQSVQGWAEQIPWNRAFELERLTGGKLRAVPPRGRARRINEGAAT